MTKVRITGLRKDLTTVLELLHAAGVMHLEDPSPAGPSCLKRILPDPEGSQEKLRIESDLIRLRGLMASLGIREGARDRIEPCVSEVRGLLDTLTPQVNHWTSERDRLLQELHLLTQYQKILSVFIPLMPHLRGSDWLGFLGFTLSSSDDRLLSYFEGTLAEITGGPCEVMKHPIDPQTLAILAIYPKTFDLEVRKVLQEEGLSEIHLPVLYADRPFIEALKAILVRKTQLPGDIQEIEEGLHQLAQEHGQILLSAHTVLQDKLAALKAAASFYGTEETFFIFGWVPDRRLPGLQSLLSRVIALRVESMPMVPQEHLRIPIHLWNPGIFKPFERLTRLLPLPLYTSLDLTPWIALGFPLFYGFMVGDAGYGVLFLVIAVVVGLKKWGHRPALGAALRDFSIILGTASVASIGFGFVFGEYLGFSGSFLGLPVGWVHREESWLMMIWVSLGVGFAHILLGLLLGLWTSRSDEDRQKVLWVLFGKILLLGSSVLVVLSVLQWIPGFWLDLGVLGLMLSLVGLLIAEKWRAPLEVMKVFSHWISYVRLMGFGAASLYLAYLANDLGGRISPFVLGWAVAIFMHLLNLLMGIYAPTVQALRLHYVEFCEKFYRTGGVPYRPFRKEAY